MEIKYKNNDLLTKSFDAKALSVDSAKGIVEMYINAFNIVDSQGDLSLPTSFNRTIKNDFSRIKHLFAHNTSAVIGLPVSFTADAIGLRVVSKMNLDANNQIARSTFSNIVFFAENDRSMENSIGAWPISGEYKENNGEVIYVVSEWKLLEYSTVAFGANEFTPYLSVKEMLNDGANFEALLDQRIKLALDEKEKYLLNLIGESYITGAQLKELLAKQPENKQPNLIVTRDLVNLFKL